jgi:type IV secretory pathway VirB2 component (pilin)
MTDSDKKLPDAVARDASAAFAAHMMTLPTESDRDRIAQALMPWADVMQQVQTALTAAAPKILDVAEQIKVGLEAVFERVAPVVAEMAEAFVRMPPAVQAALIRLGEAGWYIDMQGMSLSEPLEYVHMFEDGHVSEADEALAAHFESRLGEIEKSLTGRFPKRARIVSAAIAAHSRGDFELSVPVLLTQVDGVCHELTGGHMFLRERSGRPGTAAFVERTAKNALSSAIRSPLVQTLPINVSQKHREPDFKALNRHMVLHGESTDYGTRINSLKAISLLNYVAGVLALPD